MFDETPIAPASSGDLDKILPVLLTALAGRYLSRELRGNKNEMLERFSRKENGDVLEKLRGERDLFEQIKGDPKHARFAELDKQKQFFEGLDDSYTGYQPVFKSLHPDKRKKIEDKVFGKLGFADMLGTLIGGGAGLALPNDAAYTLAGGAGGAAIGHGLGREYGTTLSRKIYDNPIRDPISGALVGGALGAYGAKRLASDE